MSEKSEDTAQQNCEMLQKFVSEAPNALLRDKCLQNFASLQSDTFVSFHLVWRNNVFQSY